MSLVTIILTTLNSEKYVARSVESCLNQSYREIELIVVDGGSSDRTIEIIENFHDVRIKIIHQENNNGKLPGAINKGMKNASGEFFTWTQDDCWYELHAIETMLNYLFVHQEVGLVYTDYVDVDEEFTPIRYQTVHPPEDIYFDDVVRVCFLFRREIYEAIGPQNPNHHPAHEVPWRIKIAKQFTITPLHIHLMNYIVREGSLTGRLGNRNVYWFASKILLDEGFIDKKKYNQRNAQADIHQAFIEFIDYGNYRAFWKFALSGIRLDWHLLENRGILKYMVISLLPGRNKFREQKRIELRTFKQ
jgi:glycosyltransferase involved in cell wall biosynthesis